MIVGVVLTILSAVAFVAVRGVVDNARQTKVKAATTTFSHIYTAAANSGSTPAAAMNDAVKNVTGGAVTSLTSTNVTTGGGLELSTDSASAPTTVAVSAGGWCSQYNLPTPATGLGTLTIAPAAPPVRATGLGAGSCANTDPTVTGTVATPTAGSPPVTSFYARAGSTGSTSAWGVDTAGDGGTFVTGPYTGTAAFGLLPPIAGSANPSVYVARTSSNGTWQWAATATATGGANGYTVDATSDGGAIVAGTYQGTLTIGSTTLTSAGGADVFVAKVSPTGSWMWATSVGGAGSETPNSLTIRSDNSAYVTLTIPASDPFAVSIYNWPSSSYQSAALALVSAAGVPQWIVGVTGNSAPVNVGWDSLARFSDGRLALATYSAGTVNAINLGGASAGTFGSAGSKNVYVSILNTSGTWTSTSPLSTAGATNLTATGVTANSDGSIWVGGNLTGSLTVGSSSLSAASNQTWIGKLSAAGGSWVSGNTTGPANYAIQSDPSDGGVLAVGSSATSVTFGAKTYTGSGTRAWVAKMKPDQSWDWVSGVSGSSGAHGYSALRSGTSVLLAGDFSGSASFDYPSGTSVTANGPTDSLLTRITPP